MRIMTTPREDRKVKTKGSWIFEDDLNTVSILVLDYITLDFYNKREINLYVV